MSDVQREDVTRDPCGDHSEGDHFEVTQTVIVTAPRGEHGEAIRRAFALWGQPETRTNAEHNLLATHHSSTTVRVTAERNTRG